MDLPWVVDKRRLAIRLSKLLARCRKSSSREAKDCSSNMFKIFESNRPIIFGARVLGGL
jgi:hypothetical protein